MGDQEHARKQRCPIFLHFPLSVSHIAPITSQFKVFRVISWLCMFQTWGPHSKGVPYHAHRFLVVNTLKDKKNSFSMFSAAIFQKDFKNIVKICFKTRFLLIILIKIGFKNPDIFLQKIEFSTQFNKKFILVCK